MIWKALEGTEMRCFGNFPRCFVPELWLVVFFLDVHILFVFLGEVNRSFFLESDSFLQL